MPGQDTAVFGIFKAASQADKAVDRLTSAGFSKSDVSLLESNIDGLLSSMGVPEYQARRYGKEGCILLWVRCDNSLEIDRANTILEQNGAEGISSMSGEKEVGFHVVHRP
jgi:hypothetical protein